MAITDGEGGLEAEFELLMARHGITVPAEWRPGTYAGFVSLREQAATLHGVRDPHGEPAMVYRIPTGRADD
ncbi:hypothetical protein [Streptosporangium sp. NPDC049376]|uniref:hypothetical protein n=1 Tax=Streptosporangium sp. NPDC049376 TaxID=3366192 RepID=UPI0037B7CDBA